MTILNDNLLNALKSAKKQELNFVARVLDRSMKKHISIYEAAKIEKYQPGTKVNFTDKSGIEHIAIVEKVMTKRVRLFDKTTKSIVNIYPQQLRTYVPKTYAPRQEKTIRAESGIGTTLTLDAPRQKRKYVRKPIEMVAPRQKRKYVFKDKNAPAPEPRQKRKYVFKNKDAPVQAQHKVDVTPLVQKYSKDNKFSLANPRQKRKYVRKDSRYRTQ